MPYLLGIEIGETAVSAALCRRSSPPRGRAPQGSADAAWGPAEPVPLGASAPVVASSLVLSPGGEFVAGEGAVGAADQASDYVQRVGDLVDIRLAGRSVRPEALLAGMVGWVAGRLWQLHGRAPDRVAVAHPTGWGPYRLWMVRSSLDAAGLGDLTLVPRAGAVLTAFQAAGRLATGAAVLVFRLDAAGLEVSLVHPHLTGQYEFVTSAWCGDLGGYDVEAADAAGQRSILQAAVEVAARTAATCGLPPAELSAVLLAGSAAGHPLLTDLLAQAFRIPVLRLGDPQLTVACGAALAARPRTRTDATGLAPMGADSPISEAPPVTAMEPLPPGPVGALPPPRPPVRVTEAPAGRR